MNIQLSYFSYWPVTEALVQLVSHYIGGLRIPPQDVLNVFDPAFISEAHQRALQTEKQLAHRIQLSSKKVLRRVPSRSNRLFVQLLTRPHGRGVAGPGQGRPPGGLGCYGCGELGHRYVECPNAAGSRGIFSQDAFEPAPVVTDGQPVFDEYEDAAEVVEEVVSGDVGSMLML